MEIVRTVSKGKDSNLRRQSSSAEEEELLFRPSQHPMEEPLRRAVVVDSGVSLLSSSSVGHTLWSSDGDDMAVMVAATGTAQLPRQHIEGGSGGAHLIAEIPPDIPSERADVVTAMEDDEDERFNINEEVDDDLEEDDEEEYEYEDDDDAAFSGFLVDNPQIAATRAVEEEMGTGSAPATIRDDEGEVVVPRMMVKCPMADASELESPLDSPARTKKWRQPTREAVNMSLRAEQETTGGKRRLAQDLFRIMNQDTNEAGFSLAPTSEDSMDKWTIKLFKFDEDSNLAKDMRVLGLEHVELEMSFPDQYPFEPPFVRVVRPRFKRQTGFVMNGALCMELLTKDGWNPVNDIESVIVSVRSLLVVGDGRIEAAYNLSPTKYKALLEAASDKPEVVDQKTAAKRLRKNSEGESAMSASSKEVVDVDQERRAVVHQGGSYTVSEAESAYSHLSEYHKKKGWDTSGWWARKG